MMLLPVPSADAARAALSRALGDARGELTVSWWADGMGPARVEGKHATTADGPGWRGTLGDLAELLRAERSVTAAKGSGWALCGAAVRLARDGWHRRRVDLDGWELLQLDLDPTKVTARGEGLGPSVRAVAEALRALGVAAIVHPSPSARVGDGTSTRVRAWVRVARGGAPVVGDGGELEHAGRAVARALGAILGADPRAVDIAKGSPESVGFTSAAFAEALGGVEVCEGAALDPFAVALAGAEAGWWCPWVRGRAGAPARNVVALAEMLGRVEAMHPGTLGRRTGGTVCLRCPRADEHSDGRGFGGDSSCAFTADGWVGCSHSHGGAGALRFRDLLRAWGAPLDPSARAELNRHARAVEAPAAAARFNAPHVGAPGEDAPGVRWERTAEGHPVREVADIAAARAEAVDALRRAVGAWSAPPGALPCPDRPRPLAGLLRAVCGPSSMRPRAPLARRCAVETVSCASAPALGDLVCVEAVARAAVPEGLPVARDVWCILAPMGSGKSTAALSELPALLPPPPGWVDARAESPRPLAVVVTETHDAARAVAATLTAAARDPRAVEGLRVARRLPVSRVALGGGEALDASTPRECVHLPLVEMAEARGLSVPGSVCGVVGTDDPARVGVEGVGKPCPRRESCPAAAGWTWADGGPGGAPRAGEPWVGVATADSAAALPPVVLGGPHVMDECSRLASSVPVTIPADGGELLRRAEALRAVLPRDHAARREAREAKGLALRASAVAAAWGALVAWVREAVAAGTLREVFAVPPARRREALAEQLTTWAGPRGPRCDGPLRRLACDAWPTVGGVLGALDAWQSAAPTVAGWHRPEARHAGGELWRALVAWVEGAPVFASTEAKPDPSAPAEADDAPRWTERDTGGVVVRVPHVAAREVRRWVTRGPVVGLDATADVPALARAVGAAEPRSVVRGVVAVAVAVADPVGLEVRRVVMHTDRAGRGRLLRGDVVAWSAAAAVLRAPLQLLLREAPRRDGAARRGPDDGAALAPGMVCAAKPLALALAALAAGVTPARAEAGDLPADLGAVSAGDRASLAANIASAPAEVCALARELNRRASVCWTWHGATNARGSNVLAAVGGRWTLMVGDGRAPAAEARARAAAVGRDSWAQGDRDTGEAAAQLHGRVRLHALRGGAVLLLHVGAVRPLGWASPEVRALDAAEADAAPKHTASVARALPAAPTGEALDVSPEAHPVVRAAVAAGWTVAALAACAGCDPRVARRWVRGAMPRDVVALGRIEAALTSADGRGPWREVLRPGRRACDVLRGVRGVPGLAVLASMAVSDALASDGGVAPGLRALLPAELTPEALAAWVRGDDAAVSADLAALLRALGPTVARWWVGGAAAEPSTRADLARERAREAEAAVRSATARIAANLAAVVATPRRTELGPTPQRQRPAKVSGAG